MPSRTEIKEGQCESCHIFIGGKEEYYIEKYREHKICLWCQNLWKHKEEMVGHKITWVRFRRDNIKKPQE